MRTFKDVSKQLLKDSTIYSLGPIINKTISFFLLPLYTAYLLPEDYGNLQILLTTVLFLGTIARLGQKSAFWKYYNQDEFDDGVVVYNVLRLQFIVGIGLLIGVVLFASVYRSNFSILLVLLFTANLFNIIIETAYAIFRANFRSKKYVLQTVLQTLTIIGCNLLFVAYYRFSVTGVVLGYLVTYVVFSLSYGRLILTSLKAKKSTELTKQLMTYGVPLMVGNIFAYVISISDKYFILLMEGPQDLGLYSFGYKFSDVINAVLIQTITLAWNPIRWKVFKMDNGKEIFSRFNQNINYLLPIGALLCVFGVFVIAPFITLNDSYLSGLQVTLIVSVSYVINGFYWLNCLGLHFLSKTKLIMMAVGVSSIVNLGLNFVFIHYFGAVGAAYATLASYVLLFLISRHQSERFYPLTRNLSFENTLVFVIAAMSLLFTIFYHDFPNYFIIISPLLMIIVVILLAIAFNQLDPKLLHAIKKRVHK